jgi:hypothetical protein
VTPPERQYSTTSARGATQKLVVEPLRRNLSQRVLGEQRNLRPHRGVVEPVDIDAGEPAAKERRPARQLDGAPLALALDPLDLRR